MVVREVGVISQGICLVRQRYRGFLKATDDSELILRDGLVTAIENFARTVFEDQIETFMMKDRKFLIMTGRVLVDEGEDHIHIYAICDKDAPEKTVREALHRVHTAFVLVFPKISSVVCQDDFMGFAKTIDEILGDLVLRPQDRLDRLL